MTLEIDDFGDFHAAVHRGKRPFPWQQRLLRKVVEDHRWPRVLDLPTGVGKTTCVDIALFALALDAGSRDPWAPRRIAMIVDRRVVVDQVAERGRRLLRALLVKDAPAVVHEVAQRLRSLTREADEPLGVYTLRGGIPKDDGWARTPDQPLILASTVDQIGSRLLVQGYGVTNGMRPVHAGLLANDTLLLLDEVHLSRPFAETLDELDRLRRTMFADSPLPRRFQHVFLSATPGSSLGERFELLDDDRHADGPLGPRLGASKPARVVEVVERSDLERRCYEEARKLITEHAVVGVVLNRVASAITISSQLREALGSHADVVLLTGRMRPLDRDDVLRGLRPRLMTGRVRSAGARPLVIVGTQCIEAGADFDFDALVTEAASLDALRQRFGRVDRIGEYGKARGVIVWDKSNKDDPVYGNAISATMAWLKSKLAKKTRLVDFGVLALQPPKEEEQLAPLTAPAKHAPVLLPAYLDLWAQTSPEPVVAPDVSLWLHGPSAGPADVQIVWRADLSDDLLRHAFTADRSEDAVDRVLAIVGAVRPSSLEAVAVPFVVARQWLAGARPMAFADVDGIELAMDDAGGDGSLALRWRGDRSEVIDARGLRPGDTIIVPASRGGLRDHSFDPAATFPVVDLAERAALFARATPVLRLHERVLEQHGLELPATDDDEVRDALARAARRQSDDWRGLWLRELARTARPVVVGDEEWGLLRGKRVLSSALRALTEPDDTVEDGVEVTTDEEDSYHAGRSVPLAEHSHDVETHARAYAERIGLPKSFQEDLALAGWLHDIGKVDPRFQRLLRGGSEIEYLKDRTPWAKSGISPDAKQEQRLARIRSRYPAGARHEVQSLAMLLQHLDQLRTKAHDLDLVLHLVASHHGYCRPFAPVAVDDEPVMVELARHESRELGVIAFGPVASNHGFHRLDSELADRFWRLVQKYGWLELCWLEAVLRLADHRASELEQGRAP